MKDESVSALLESGEIQMTEDVVFMVDLVINMFDRAAETERDQFISYGLQLLEVWRNSLATNDDKMELSAEALNIVMGKP